MSTVSGVGGSLMRARPVHVSQLTIPLPDLAEQRRIAAILDKADAVRRKRQQALALTDELLRSTFLDMFGDPVTNPKGWEVVTIGDLVDDVKYGSSTKAGASGKWPMLRMNNITSSGGWDFADLKYVDLVESELEKYTVRSGDLLFNRTNSKELVGKTAVYREDTPMAFAGYLIRARANSEADPEYISGYLNSAHGKTTLRGMCKSIIGMANINAKELQAIRLLKPPMELQHDFGSVVRKVEERRSRLVKGITVADELFNSVLQRAFRGEL
jgi:type I restriction enzyme S subunit